MRLDDVGAAGGQQDHCRSAPSGCARKEETAMALSRERLEARAAEMRSAFEEAARRNEWSWLADAFYAEHCRYVCEYGGTMLVEARSREEIRATHYGRDMRVGWEGWTFPIERYAVQG